MASSSGAVDLVVLCFWIHRNIQQPPEVTIRNIEKCHWFVLDIFSTHKGIKIRLHLIIKRDRPLRDALDRECPLITNKLAEILDCIPCVMVLLLHSASRTQISTTMHQTFDLDLDLWPWPRVLTLTFDLDLKARSKITKFDIKTRLNTVWPWPLTYNLEIQSQPSQHQDQPSCQKSRS